MEGDAYVWVRGEKRAFADATRHCAVEWFGLMVSDYLADRRLPGEVWLVPVPGSTVRLGVETRHRTVQLAEAIAAGMSGERRVADVLRWARPLPSAPEAGGRRPPELLYPNVRVTSLVRHQSVVLVDDVLISGSHLRACAARLYAGGARVLCAVTAGRADDTPVADPFGVRVEDLADFPPV